MKDMMKSIKEYFDPRARAIRKHGDIMPAWAIDTVLENHEAFPGSGVLAIYVGVDAQQSAKQNPNNFYANALGGNRSPLETAEAIYRVPLPRATQAVLNQSGVEHP